MLNLPIKNYLIIGSHALGVRPAKDIDVICYKADVEVPIEGGDDYAAKIVVGGRTVELLFADKQESFQLMLREELTKYLSIPNIATVSMLFAIKAGHITFPHKQWEKHIMDYHILKGRLPNNNLLGILPDPNKKHPNDHNIYVTLESLTKLHKKSTEDRIGKQKLPKLIGVSKQDFFDDFVVKFYEHDDIHQMVAHKEFPMYHYMQRDYTKVECHKDMWDEFTQTEKLQCVLEECYVIALERHIIPTMKGTRIGLNYHEAFKWALMRVCTTLCSGWFRSYAIDNYFTLLNSYNKEYYKLLDTSKEISKLS